MGKELAKAYEPHEVEERIYEFWMNGRYFHAEVDSKKKPYTIVIPPPNITGQLHMGHALDETLQDILIRFRRMQGYSALWPVSYTHLDVYKRQSAYHVYGIWLQCGRCGRLQNHRFSKRTYDCNAYQ